MYIHEYEPMCSHASSYACKYVRTYVYTYAYVYRLVYVNTHVRTCVNMCTYMYVRTCIYVQHIACMLASSSMRVYGTFHRKPARRESVSQAVGQRSVVQSFIRSVVQSVGQRRHSS